jgi:hypothetical protein
MVVCALVCCLKQLHAIISGPLKETKNSDSLPVPKVISTQVQSENSGFIDEGLEPNNKLAQRLSSIASDDLLLGDQVLESKVNVRDNSISEDQEVLLELNTEEQEQFEVLESADGEDGKSEGDK